jgi:hypothetical protein
MTAFPPDWHLGFLMKLGGTDEDPQFEVAFLPIVGMEAYGVGIRAVVAVSSTGELKRDTEIAHPVVCIAAPGEDRKKCAAAGVGEYIEAQARAKAKADEDAEVAAAAASKTRGEA